MLHVEDHHGKLDFVSFLHVVPENRDLVPVLEVDEVVLHLLHLLFYQELELESVVAFLVVRNQVFDDLDLVFVVHIHLGVFLHYKSLTVIALISYFKNVQFWSRFGFSAFSSSL